MRRLGTSEVIYTRLEQLEARMQANPSLYNHWAREFAIPRFSALRLELHDECFELANLRPRLRRFDRRLDSLPPTLAPAVAILRTSMSLPDYDQLTSEIDRIIEAHIDALSSDTYPDTNRFTHDIDGLDIPIRAEFAALATALRQVSAAYLPR